MPPKPTTVCPVCLKEVEWPRPNRPRLYCSTSCARKDKTRPLEEKFWKHVEKTDTCWLFTGPGDRYGHIWDNGHIRQAHRISYEMHIGPIPDGMKVCHQCDVMRCVNPDHLFLGTHADNMSDRNDKGRQCKGERYPHAKLNETDVRAIRASYAARDATTKELAARYNVSLSLIGHVIARRNWKHVA